MFYIACLVLAHAGGVLSYVYQQLSHGTAALSVSVASLTVPAGGARTWHPPGHQCPVPGLCQWGPVRS
jgi:hypothetical protein